MTYSDQHKTGGQGFTLIEILIAIAISGLIIAALYSFYMMQKQTGETQQDVAAVQQDLRGLMQMMAQDIRMAGYAPVDTSGFGFQNNVQFHSNGDGVQDIVNTDANAIAFTSDMNDASFTGDLQDKSNGKVDYDSGQHQQEQFAYRFWNQGAVCANRGCIQRYMPSTDNRWEEVALDIDGLQFLYTLHDGTMTISPAATNDLGNIASVTVTVLARAHSVEPRYRNTEIYRPASCFQPSLTSNPADCPSAFNGGQPYNDNRRRQMLTFTVNCRNQR